MVRRGMKSALCFLLFGVLCSASAFAGSILSVDPLSSSVSLGSNFTLDINIANVTDLYAFQFDIGFGPSVLQAMGVLEGPFLATGGCNCTSFFPGFIDNGAGNVTFIANTLLGPGPGVNGSGTLAILQFLASGAGTSTIDISNFILLDSNLNEIDATTESGTVTVTSPIPEPSGILMVGFGVVWMAGALSRKLRV